MPKSERDILYASDVPLPSPLIMEGVDEESYRKGYLFGHRAGERKGYKDALKDVYRQFRVGYKQGYDLGHDDGFTDGYNRGRYDQTDLPPAAKRQKIALAQPVKLVTESR